MVSAKYIYGSVQSLTCSRYLGELGLPYDPILMDMRAGDHRKPAFLAINPFGKVSSLI